MEFIPGQSLDQVIPEGGLGEEEVRRLGVQLADGLVALHEHGMVHRDLKPSNLRLTRDGRLKILDFGLASLLQPVTNEPTATRTGGGEFAGTLPYMAPEQIRGEAVDERTDVYAAGAVLYEMATGRPLFPGARSGELIGAILSQAPPKPKLVNPRLSESLEHLLSLVRALSAVGSTAKRPGIQAIPQWTGALLAHGRHEVHSRNRLARELTRDLEPLSAGLNSLPLMTKGVDGYVRT
jgi:serine/threonine protein kinase